MLEELRKKAQTSMLVKVCVALVIALACLAYTSFGIFSYFAGPKDITNMQEWDPEELSGKYVTIDVDYVFGNFATETSTDSKTHHTTTTSQCYLCVHSYDEGAQMYAVKVAERDKKGLEKIVDELIASNGDSSETTQRVTGTFKKMSDKMLQYYDESIEEGLGSEYLDYAVPYCIFDNTIGGKDEVIVFLLSIVAAGAVIYAVYALITFLSGNHDKYLKKYLASNPNETMPGIEADYAAAFVADKNYRVGKKYLFYFKGGLVHLVTMDDMVWAYYYRRTGKNSVSQIRTFNFNKKETYINMSNDQANKVLGYIAENFPHVVVGYDRELEQTYKKDFGTFLNLKYNTAKESAVQSGENLY